MIVHAIEGYVDDGNYNTITWTVKAFTSYELAEQFLEQCNEFVKEALKNEISEDKFYDTRVDDLLGFQDLDSVEYNIYKLELVTDSFTEQILEHTKDPHDATSRT